MKKLTFAPLAFAVLAATPAFAAHAKPGLWKMTTVSQINGDQKTKSGGPFCRLASQADAAPVVGRDCTQKNVKWNGNAVSGDTVCTPPVSGTGHFAFTYKGDTHYDGTYNFSGQAPMMGAMKMTTQYSADYVGASCGNVKPL